MYVRKEQAGNIPGYSWVEDGETIYVEDHIAEHLLTIPNGGFTEGSPPVETYEPITPDMFAPKGELLEPARRAAGRPKLPRDEDGKIIRN